MLKFLNPKKLSNSFPIRGIASIKKELAKWKSQGEPKIKKPTKVQTEISTFFTHESNYDPALAFPEFLLKKKTKQPHNYYVASKMIAEIIKNFATADGNLSVPYLEINPGIGLLTRELVNSGIKRLHLIEGGDGFIQRQKYLKNEFPCIESITYLDFIAMWRLLYMDRQDGGTRVKDMLSVLPQKPWSDDVNAKIILHTGSLSFFKHLIHSLVFQTGILSYGRPEFYVTLSPYLYIHLTCAPPSTYFIYRASSILFQTFFEHRLLARLPRETFLPWHARVTAKTMRKAVFERVDDDWLYLVRIVPRRELPELLPFDLLPAFWFFVRQTMNSRSNRVIPWLEQWIPYSGPRLLVQGESRVPATDLEAPLIPVPPYSASCKRISTQDSFPGFTLFTEFGEMTASQMLTLFLQFNSWPEYRESGFLFLLESAINKVESTPDESVNEMDEEDEAKSQEEVNKRNESEKN